MSHTGRHLSSLFPTFRKSPSSPETESDSHAVLASPLTIWSRCARVIPKSRIMPPPSRQLETSSRHLPPQLTPLPPAWNSRTAVIENHADNRYWERHIRLRS